MKTEIYKIKTDQAWNRLYNRLDNDRLLAKVDEGCSIRKHSQWIRYGAVAAVLIGVVWGALYWMTGSEREPAQNFLTQENQGISTLATTLEDGSVVLLAKETSLLYPKHFIADKREVSLQGNAFFDVAKKQGKLTLLLTCLLASISLTIAQTSKKVTGVVFSEEDNQPVIGASVVIKGTPIGTTTDLAGKFVISNVPSSSRTW